MTGFAGCPPSVVIPAYAGMDYVNHWIPACAGMTGGWGQALGKHGKGVVEMATHLFPPFVVIPAKAGIQRQDAGR